MARFIRRGSKKTGQVPGTAVYVGEKRAAEVRVSRFEYDESDVRRDMLDSVEECLSSHESPQISWINVDGVHDVEKIQRIGEGFNLHPLIIEDIVHTGQRPKVEEYESILFIVLRMLRWSEESEQIDDEQVSVVLGPSWVVSFQERAGDVFDPIRERIQSNRGRIRKLGSDYLAYALIDAVVDHYFSILETLGERIEALGEDMTENPKREDLQSIRHMKRELLFMRKSVWPLREVLSSIQRDESQLIREATQPYLRDVYDHTIQIIDTVETFRDMVSGLMDLYLSSISNRMNEVMKVLTIIATIFIPLSFFAGLYGMNFVYMPELQWRFGYFGLLGLMFAVCGGMLLYFRRRKWL
ncbi:magnesium/cobalt transporter CorA [Candidatus Bipolaricaulota bacterium]